MDVVSLAQALVRAQSVTPAGPTVFDVLEKPLQAAGFTVERLSFGEGNAAVLNLVATRGGNGPHLALCGHVDTVPPGDTAAWTHGPFDGVIDGDTLYGRGAQDMKGGVAAMAGAAIRWADKNGPGRISLLITGDEEGPAIHGTRDLVEWCKERMAVDVAIVGEPTSRKVLGDTIKVGRRGSVTGTVRVTGRQGHVAYPDAADNPIPDLLAISAALLAPLDDGTDVFQPSNLEVVSVDVGNPADNVIPAEATLRFNVRFNDEWTSARLMEALEARMLAAAPERKRELQWRVSGEAFRANDPQFIATVTDAVEAATGVRPEATTGGGTSDARFIVSLCPVVEFGAVGDRMHQVDEATSCAELRRLEDTYSALIGRIMGTDGLMRSG